MAEAEILLEQRRIGSYLRVAAICAETGVEVVFMAPADAGPALVESLAAAKLAHVKTRRREQDEAGGKGEPRPPRGVIV